MSKLQRRVTNPPQVANRLETGASKALPIMYLTVHNQTEIYPCSIHLAVSPE
ncbi:MAG TPA: hypothetical protein VGY99_00240 [Candidatus Binataceae bacterium]|jgi:hypothetical protein|nr:hypothetical protein [Candidatus Binataceae bacterium]